MIKLEQLNDNVTVLTLNRPESRNALSTELLSELEKNLKDIAPRVLIITGEGSVFCAGADLKERAGMTPEEANETSINIGRKIKMIEDLPYVTIAAMNGGAFGGGLELALACDFRIMNENIKVGLTETSLGIIPGAGGTQRLTKIAGPSISKLMIFTAEPVNAEKALQYGIADIVSDDVMRDAVKLSIRISKNAPVALQAAKKAVNKAMDLPIEEGLKFERECYDMTLHTEDRIEGLMAFKEKRQPNYKGK